MQPVVLITGAAGGVGRALAQRFPFSRDPRLSDDCRVAGECAAQRDAHQHRPDVAFGPPSGADRAAQEGVMIMFVAIESAKESI